MNVKFESQRDNCFLSKSTSQMARKHSGNPGNLGDKLGWPPPPTWTAPVKVTWIKPKLHYFDLLLQLVLQSYTLQRLLFSEESCSVIGLSEKMGFRL